MEHIHAVLVEDNAGDARLVLEALRETGTDVISLEHIDSLTALSSRMAQGGVGLIFLDLGLPESQGLDTLIRARSLTANAVPIIVLTGRNDAAAGYDAIREGAQDYLVKGSVRGSELIRSVQYAVERHRSQESLRASERRFRSITESAQEGILIAEVGTRTFLYANPEICRMLGYTTAELLALGVKDIHPAEDIPEIARSFALQASGARMDAPARCLRKDGSIFPVSIRAVPFELDGKECLIGFFSDQSERRMLEEERIKSQKLEAVGLLAGGIAHNFNNLLQSIFGHIYLARQESGGCGNVGHLLDETEAALNQAVSLTNQLLTFAKGGQPAKTAVHLDRLMESTIQLSLSGSCVSAELDLPGDVLPINGDAGQVGQVMQNLIMNAAHAMPQGGTVRVSVRNTAAPGDDVPVDLLPGAYVAISVKDDGIGISPEHLAKIYDPYFTTKEYGNGLGLTSVYSIMRNHGGAITVRSEVGKGSEFTVYFAAAQAKNERKHASLAGKSGWKGRILVMDDEQPVRKIIGKLLTALGHEVELAMHGEDAVDRYRRAMEANKPFDAVILDLTVRGGMGGAEAIRHLRALNGSVKAVASSGYADDRTAAEFSQHGFAAFLKKPYNSTELRATLDQLLP